MKKIFELLFMSLIVTIFNSSNSVANTISSVNMSGSFQDEIGCSGDWQPDCINSNLMKDPIHDVWANTFSIPGGLWDYKATINGTFNENYGEGGVPNGSNITLNLSEATYVKFYYDENTHWVTDNINSLIVTAPGSYQSALGCSDWDPTCLGSWLKDPDGDGIFTFSALLPIGEYVAKVTIGESWDENYGLNGELNGSDISFNVSNSSDVFFSYNSTTHILNINQSDIAPVPEPSSFLLFGAGLAGLGFYARKRMKI